MGQAGGGAKYYPQYKPIGKLRAGLGLNNTDICFNPEESGGELVN